MFWVPLCYQEVIFLQGDNYFLFYYSWQYILQLFQYITMVIDFISIFT